jgi:sortase A
MRTTKPARTKPRRATGPGRVVRVIGVLGRIFVAAGLLILFYTTYLLWGTGVYTAQEQERLSQELAQAQPEAEAPPVISGDEVPSARPAAKPKMGAPLFTLVIPDLGFRQVVVNGVEQEDLKKGPGHFPDCKDVAKGVDCVDDSKFPGEGGNVAISGHRTTYGAPFFRLNELKPGAVIDVESNGLRYRYKARGQKIVDPFSGFEVVKQHGKDELTLTTCHPRFSAAQRLIVGADFEGVAPITRPTPAKVGGKTPVLEPNKSKAVIPADVLVLASVSITAALAAMALSRRMRIWAAYSAVVIGGSAALWVAVFPQIIRLMPANY